MTHATWSNGAARSGRTARSSGVVSVGGAAVRSAVHVVVLVASLAFLPACSDAPPPAASPAAGFVRPAADLPRTDVAPPPGVVVPDGMAYVPGGAARVGAEEGDPLALPHEFPAFDAAVAPYLIDRSPVTVGRFRRFVDATGFETEAERFGNGAVFDTVVSGWTLLDGASWHHPLGPAGDAAPSDHPVTQVSWNDAVAFCAWDGAAEGRPKRLPTEVEWEYAARAARRQSGPYAWGDRLADVDSVGGSYGAARYHANTWTGTFPAENTGADGYRTTSPVGAFGANPLGLTDMGGNVWEWTADWYRPYADRERPFTPTAQSEKATRGGSFMCHADYCHGYRVSGRSHATPETSLFHVGFRCVRDVARPRS